MSKFKTPNEHRMEKILDHLGDKNFYVYKSMEESKVCKKFHPDGKFHNTKFLCKDCFYNAFTNYELNELYGLKTSLIDKLYLILLTEFIKMENKR